MGQVNLNERLSEMRVRLDRQRNRAPEPVPKFLSLTRKETRVREDQYAELTALARTLMRDRVSRRERITENTLIRIAIDLLLAHRDQLRGSDEGELRRSVTSGVPDFRSPKGVDTGSSEGAESRSPEARDFRSGRVSDYRSGRVSDYRSGRDRHPESSAKPGADRGSRS